MFLVVLTFSQEILKAQISAQGYYNFVTKLAWQILKAQIIVENI